MASYKQQIHECQVKNEKNKGLISGWCTSVYANDPDWDNELVFEFKDCVFSLKENYKVNCCKLFDKHPEHVKDNSHLKSKLVIIQALSIKSDKTNKKN